MILDDITANTCAEVAERKRNTPLSELRTRAELAPPPRGFIHALVREHVALIAEVKRASPSRGAFGASLNPIQLACTYAESGASAISVLTDARYFYGSLADLAGAASVDAGAQGFRRTNISFTNRARTDPMQSCSSRGF
jgi:indole-3-glycerol phosphate synthase